MGNWKIIMEGIGSHHNDGYAGDANELGKAMVEQLARAGQTVTAARFEHGASGNYDNLMPAPDAQGGALPPAGHVPETDFGNIPKAQEPDEPTDLQDAATTEDPQ